MHKDEQWDKRQNQRIISSHQRECHNFINLMSLWLNISVTKRWRHSPKSLPLFPFFMLFRWNIFFPHILAVYFYLTLICLIYPSHFDSMGHLFHQFCFFFSYCLLLMCSNVSHSMWKYDRDNTHYAYDLCCYFFPSSPSSSSSGSFCLRCSLDLHLHNYCLVASHTTINSIYMCVVYVMRQTKYVPLLLLFSVC